LLLLLFVWFLPWLAAHSPLPNWLARRLLNDFHGNVTVGHASLGWFSPIVLGDVEVRDAEGRALLVAPRIESSRSLADLLLQPSDVGTVRCEQPTLAIVFSGRQSNLERACSSWLAPVKCDKPDKENGPAPGQGGHATIGRTMNFEMVDGKLTIQDDDTAGHWTIGSMNLSLQLSGQSPHPVQGEFHGLLPEAGPDGRIDATLGASAGQDPSHEGRLTVQFNALPAALAAPLLRRLKPETRVDGQVSGQLELQSLGGPVDVKLDLTLRDLCLGAPPGPIWREPDLRLRTGGEYDPAAGTLQLARGVVLDRVHLSPEMCANGLKYALPILAGATEVEGQVSFALDGGRVPLAGLSQAEVAGNLTLHSVKINAAPLLKELGVVVKGPTTATIANEDVVAIRIANGRIYHSNLVLVLPDITIRTQGSVGLDGTLDLVAEMPIPPKWLPPGQQSASLSQQVIRLPIGGTLEKPKLDQRALQAVKTQLVHTAADQLLHGKLGDKLGNLLGPR